MDKIPFFFPNVFVLIKLQYDSQNETDQEGDRKEGSLVPHWSRSVCFQQRFNKSLFSF